MAPDHATGDNFGVAVSLDGSLLAIGADQDDDAGNNSGAVYVYRLEGTTWVYEAKVTAPDGAAGDHFGQSVAISDDRMLVGAQQRSEVGTGSGATYVFARNAAGQWMLYTKLAAPGALPGDRFGASVALSHGAAVAATPGRNANAGDAYIFGVGGDCNHNAACDLCDIAAGRSLDGNNNGIPDECEFDSDTDGLVDANDNCPFAFNPDQADADRDGVGDVCDNCPAVSNTYQEDADADGFGDVCDNCPTTYNPLQKDTNHNGIGDACELRPGDVNCDGAVDFRDINPFVLALSNPSQWQETYAECRMLNGDINGDGSVNFRDINPFVACLSSGHCP